MIGRMCEFPWYGGKQEKHYCYPMEIERYKDGSRSEGMVTDPKQMDKVIYHHLPAR
jgi:hypothetical protein